MHNYMGTFTSIAIPFLFLKSRTYVPLGTLRQRNSGLEDSPSLERYLAEIFERTYQVARREAENLMGLQLPQNCEWTLQQVRDDSFYPKPAIPSS